MKPDLEFSLAVACCRWPCSREGDAAVVAASATGIDWQRFLRVAQRHRIEGLAYAALRRAEAGVPAAIAAALRTRAVEIAGAGLRAAAEAARLRGMFDAAGIQLLVLKGTPLAMLAYGTLALKDGRDIDLLVPAAQAARAAELIAAAGYRPAWPSPAARPLAAEQRLLVKEQSWTSERGFAVDLHWRLADPSCFLSALPARAPREVTVAPGVSLPTLADEELFAYLAFHGAGHSWSRLKWLADAAAFLARFDDDGKRALFLEARASGAGHAPALCLLLCHRLFAVALPADLVATVERDAAARRLAWTAMAAMTGKSADRELAARPLLMRLLNLSTVLIADDARGVREILALHWLGLHDRATIGLPRPLYFLYPLLRVPNLVWRTIREIAVVRPGRGAGG